MFVPSNMNTILKSRFRSFLYVLVHLSLFLSSCAYLSFIQVFFPFSFSSLFPVSLLSYPAYLSYFSSCDVLIVSVLTSPFSLCDCVFYISICLFMCPLLFSLICLSDFSFSFVVLDCPYSFFDCLSFLLSICVLLIYLPLSICQSVSIHLCVFSSVYLPLSVCLSFCISASSRPSV